MTVTLRLDWCSYQAARYAVEHWHYSRSMPKSKIVKIGAWENGEFVGCVLFGVGATATLVQRYGLKPQEGCELVRVALKNGHFAPVSKIVALAIKMLRKQSPDLRLIVSFADPEQKHVGIIYQAMNWVYCGQSEASDEYVYLGKRWQGRAFRHRFGGMEHHPDVQVVKGGSKHRYLYPLDDNIRKQIEPLRQPYPKKQ